MLTIPARTRSLDGAFTVERVLPAPARRHLGPFVFLDHMGPATFAPGQKADVRPHPHIGLATITYLFEGQIRHKDSLGSDRVIAPNDVNLMIAGSGIVHSERAPIELVDEGFSLHGVQLWIALPDAEEECAASFHHHDGLPEVTRNGARVRVVIGSALGLTSKVPTLSPTLLVDVSLDEGAELSFLREHDEIGLYVISGDVTFNGEKIEERSLGIVDDVAARDLTIAAKTSSRALLLGGTHLGERHIFWNFVSSSEARIEKAARDWKMGTFPKVPGDEIEFIPLTDEPPWIKKAGKLTAK